MKILFISKYIPYQAEWGSGIKMLNLLTCISGAFDVACAFIVDERHGNQEAIASCRLPVTNYLLESKHEPFAPKRYLVHLLELFTISSKIRTALSAIMEKERPDVVWLEFSYIGHYIPFLKKFGVPVVYVSHNSQFALDYGIWKSNGNIAYRLKMGPFVLLYQIHEKRYFKLADLVLCISRQDMDYYARLISPEKLRVLPFLFPEVKPAATHSSTPDPPYICMIGSLRSYQNYAAAVFAIEQVWPLLLKENGRLQLHIVGQLPGEGTPEYRYLNRIVSETERVNLTGRVDSVVPFIREATAQLVPLLIGSGVRTKIIESAVCRTPVVSTTIGAEGLPFVDGTSIFIADTAADLAEKVLLLVNDPATRNEMAENAFATYRAQLSCEVGVRLVKTFLRELGIPAG